MSLAIHADTRTTESAAPRHSRVSSRGRGRDRHAPEGIASRLLAVAATLGAFVTMIGALLMTVWRRAARALVTPSQTRSGRGSSVEPRTSAGAPAAPFGLYTLGEKIGEGGMGVVYKARHALSDRPQAIKLLPLERAEGRAIRRFTREFQLTSQLHHPNTIAVYDFGRTPEGSLYYAMEYLEGMDLQALVDRTGPQPAARVAHLLAQICSALGEAHRAGLIHRDIKPANVFLCEGEESCDAVKVLDFGLIKEVGAAESDGNRTEVDKIVGTPTYLAPEAVTAPDTMDGRSDLYAVGALGYFLLTGVPPFSGRTLLEVCAQHLHCEPLPPSRRTHSAIPSALEELILSCLAKSPEQRPSDAEALRAALLPLAAQWTDEAASAESADRRMAPARRACLVDAAWGGRQEVASVCEAA